MKFFLVPDPEDINTDNGWSYFVGDSPDFPHDPEQAVRAVASALFPTDDYDRGYMDGVDDGYDEGYDDGAEDILDAWDEALNDTVWNRFKAWLSESAPWHTVAN